ncbi:MFS transporter [Neobacillus cucumis]|uniref:MFS transporter n=1 Tax=Neobacillus cucumis TaxID=1740721 RepID=UPI00203D6A3A|nr:MFS transporter [Neobacillus cucumis]MCM3729544.1 MFS transporter [Neobacillus cucumis]
MNKVHDHSYEWKAILLLSIAFGLVGLDRWIISPLFPVMMEDLNLNYQDLGNITAILAISWGIFSILLGGISDKIGRRKILIPSMLAFSLLAGLSGLAGGLMSLLLIRAMMGVFEGAFTPVSIASTQEASNPKRRGFNMGLQQSAFVLFGLGLGPIFATQLLKIVPSWHWVFVLVSIPGFIVAFLLYKVIKEPEHVQLNKKETKEVMKKIEWKDLFKHRNVWLCMFGLFGVMTALFVISAMIPNYLTDYLQLSISEMGFVTSAVGFGGFIGALVLPGISDKLGRKPVLMTALLVAIGMILLFMNTGANAALLFPLLFIIAGCIFGCLTMLAGPVTTESVPPALVASAAGIPIGAGEIFGGGVSPVIAGFVAQNYGIEHILLISIVGLIVSLVISVFLIETAPAKMKRTTEIGDVKIIES